METILNIWTKEEEALNFIIAESSRASLEQYREKFRLIFRIHRNNKGVQDEWYLIGIPKIKI